MSNRFAGLASRTAPPPKVEEFIQGAVDRQNGITDSSSMPEPVQQRKPKEKKQVQKVLVSFTVPDAQLLGELAHLPIKCTQSEIVSAAVRAFGEMTVEQQLEWIKRVQI